MLGFAAEFEIGRPTTQVGWIVLVVVGVLLLFVINEGLQKITERTFKPFKKTIFFLFGVLFVVLVAADQNNQGSDPLVEVEVLDEGGVNGVHAESDPNHHDVDPDHTHGSNN